jgi:hypothetical protein
MNFFGFAPIVTNIQPTDTNGTDVFAGNIVKVWGFSVSKIGAGNATVTVRTNETLPATVFMGLIAANTSVIVPIPFIADKGLEVVTTSISTTSFTFWHSQVGT